MLCGGNLVVVDFGQSIYVVVTAFDAEILCQVDDFHVGGYGMFLEERLALSVTEAEEHHVNLVERHLVGKLQFGIAYESFMNITYKVACIAF